MPGPVIETIAIDTQAAADALLQRFIDFCDGVVLSVAITTTQLPGDRLLRIEFGVREYDATWYRVTFRFTGVERYLFEESPRSHNIVLSDGIKLHVADDFVIVDLWPLPAGVGWVPGDIERAGQYVVAATCSAEIALDTGTDETSAQNQLRSSIQTAGAVRKPDSTVPHASPVAPLVVASEDGILLFASPQLAGVYLEAPDIEDGIHGPAFDAEGRLVAVSLPPEPFERRPRGRLALLRWKVSPGYAPLIVELAESEPNHRAELVALLQTTLATSDETLDRLIAAAIKRFGVIGVKRPGAR